jgi:hypothetical protein
MKIELLFGAAIVIPFIIYLDLFPFSSVALLVVSAWSHCGALSCSIVSGYAEGVLHVFIFPNALA